MNSIKKCIGFLLKSDRSQKVKLLRMLFLLIKFSILVRCIPLKYYFKRYFRQNFVEHEDNLQPYMEEIGQLVRIGILLPWRVTCLIESLAVKEYLKEYGINLKIRLGFLTSEGIHAHAWYLPNKRNDYIELNY